ncbi:FUZ family protein [Megaselia abdita]
MTSIHLMCLTTISGLPLFTKKRGDCESLPFSTVASLNGVHMFCKTVGMELQSTYCEDWILCWKDFHESLTIVIAAKGLTEKNIEHVMSIVVTSITLFVCMEDLKNIDTIQDRMKKESKNFMPMIDKTLDILETDILEYTDCILPTENPQLLSKLGDFSGQVNSHFCSIFINHKIAVATEGWWGLDSFERKALSILFCSAKSPLNESVIFLPSKDVNSAFRIVTVPLSATMAICAICGAEPLLPEIQMMVQHTFKNDIDLLLNAEKCVPRNFPDNIEFDSRILGIILLNKTVKKCAISRHIQQSSSGKRTLSGSHRMSILKSFFDEAVDALDDFIEDSKLSCLSQYWSSEYHKCNYTTDGEGNLICVLYVASIPTYTMNLVTEDTLKKVLEDKSTCW